MLRLLHHAHTRTRPDPDTFSAGPCPKGLRPPYIPPGAPTIIAPFIVQQDFVATTKQFVMNTSSQRTWELIRDTSKMEGLGSLQVQEKGVTGGDPGRTHQVLAPRLHVMIAGAPVLATILSEVPTVLEMKVCKAHFMQTSRGGCRLAWWVHAGGCLTADRALLCCPPH